MSHPKKIQDLYKLTKIWQYFSSISSPEKQTLVEKLVEDASGILDRIIETFPTYTLHNGQHQLNILNLYSELLGSEINQLTDLETAILILSAFFHDIGMVFKDSEKDDLKNEANFNSFLTENISAKLAVAEEGIISQDIAEWYCRWCHAKRVWQYLDPLNEKLIWEGNNFRKELAKVCLSHNEKSEFIKSDKLSSNFWNNSDLKFCAILLRIADVLDFDDSRSPESVYYFLELDNPKRRKDIYSQIEWKKHFASRGFSFENWSRETKYTLFFQAAPREPSIEHDIHEFLNYIENELKECSSILHFCSERWKNFKLPERIDRTNIISQGYTFGNFKFTLDQDQILSLLMGENLYEDKNVFIRELLQNAIDTSRHRKFYEINKGNSSFEPKQIDVTTWHDTEGFRWIRIDDYGMGMTHSQILNYFLKVGNSYYNSDEFKVEKLAYRNNEQDFVPVSRFGIGVLSCFIVGDTIEINTKSVFTDNSKIYPVRLSLKGLHNFYIMQTNEDIPSEMPKIDKNETNYRNEYGTSIAIRIRANNDLPDFDLGRILDSILFNPEVPVNFISKGRKGRYLLGLDKKSIEIIEYKLNKEELDQLYSLVEDSDILKIDPIIKIVPIDLNRTFSHNNISGFLYMFVLVPNIERKKSIIRKRNDGIYFEGQESELNIKLNYWGYSQPKLELELEGLKERNYRVDNKDLDLSHLLSSIEIFNGNSTLNEIFNSLVISHNGILIANKNKNPLKIEINYSDSFPIIGYLELSDKLRPNLSISRNYIHSIPWSIWSTLNYTIRNNFPDEFSDYKVINFLKNSNVTTSNFELNEDNLLLEEKYWAHEKLFHNSTVSIVEILEGANEFEVEVFNRGSSPESILKKKIVELYSVYKISVHKKKSWNEKYHIIKKASVSKSGSSLFKPEYPPLCFCEYENFDGLMPESLNNQIMNINHPFSTWIIKSYQYLKDNYSNHLYILLNNTDISIINATINKLRLMLPDSFKPPIDLHLSEEDFKIDFELISILE